MKHYLVYSLAIVLISTTLCFAQFEPTFYEATDISLVDINNNTHNLYTYLEDDKAVLLVNFASINNTNSWELYQSGALQTLHNTIGSGGSNELIIILIEVIDNTSIDDLNGSSAASNGDWITGNPIPVVDTESFLDPPYNSGGVPTANLICQNKIATFLSLGDAMSALTFLTDLISESCPSLDGNNNVAIREVLNHPLRCIDYESIITIQNLGDNVLNSTDINFFLNEDLVETINWTGSLDPYYMDTLTFSTVNLQEEDLTFTASNPNGAIDDNDSNNTLFIEIDYNLQYALSGEFEVEVFTDNYADEIYWAVIDEAENIVAEGGNLNVGIDGGGLGYPDGTSPGTYQDNQTYNESFVLDEQGCYNFVLVDSFGDGICCNYGTGYVTLSSVNSADNFTFTISEFTDYVYFTISYLNTDYKITTTPFLDTNNNNDFDDGVDPILQGQTFENDFLNYYLFSSGIGSFYTDTAGTYSINFVQDGDWVTANPSQSATVNQTDSTVNLYYSLTPTSIFNEISLDITSGITRCNLETNFWLTVCNEGTTFESGNLVFEFSDTMQYFSANPTPDSIVNNLVYYNFDNLPPTNCQTYNIVLSMPDYNFLGEDMNVNANYTNGPNHAETEYSSELICAYDPNDKQVMPNGAETNGILDMTQDTTLTYTIRFQNTGNDTAFHVTVIDSLSSLLDLSTFKFISTSHPISINLDQNTRAVTFDFENILLPDSNVNEVASHGFIKFSIDVNDGLPVNIDIDNKAEIYFDANPPIVTNTVISSYKVIPVYVEPEKNILELYPNPTAGLVNINSNLNFNSIEVYNIKGEIILQEENKNKIDLSNFSNGTYLIGVYENEKFIMEKILLQKLD